MLLIMIAPMNDNITKKINHELNESIKTDFSIKLITSSAFNRRNANSNIRVTRMINDRMKEKIIKIHFFIIHSSWYGANYTSCFYHEKGIQAMSISSMVKFRMETDRYAAIALDRAVRGVQQNSISVLEDVRSGLERAT